MNIWLKIFIIAFITFMSEKIKNDRNFLKNITETKGVQTDMKKNIGLQFTMKKYMPDILKSDYSINKRRNDPCEVPHVSLTREQAFKQGWHYKRKSNNRLRITRYTGEKCDITIPAEIDGLIVNEIGKEVFMGAVIYSVQIPDTIKKINEKTFYKSKLITVTFAEGVEKIPAEAFAYCKKLESVHLPNSLNHIGERAFYGCEKLKNIVLPCYRVGEEAFCTSGLENISYAVGVKYFPWDIIDGSVISNTPLQENYRFILLPYERKNYYNILLVGTFTKFKFPKDSEVKLNKNSVTHGCKLDFSECRTFKINENFIRCRRDSRGIIWSHPACEIVMPYGTRRYFPDFVDAQYPNGSDCRTNFEIIENNEKHKTIKVHKTPGVPEIYSYSLSDFKTESLTLTADDTIIFSDHAVDMTRLKNFSSCAVCGKGELFSINCWNLHRVEINGKIIYIPSGKFNYNAYKQLLKAFTCRNYKFFDSDIYRQVFTEDIDSYSEYGSSRKKHRQLSQRDKIMLAVDVLRSSEEFFTDRNIYEKYLRTHKKYALIICDSLPEEYVNFLNNFYSRSA